MKSKTLCFFECLTQAGFSDGLRFFYILFLFFNFKLYFYAEYNFYGYEDLVDFYNSVFFNSLCDILR